jgi:hypothetical protein
LRVASKEEGSATDLTDRRKKEEGRRKKEELIVDLGKSPISNFQSPIENPKSKIVNC